MLQGLMMDRPMLITQLLDHAASFYPNAGMTVSTVEGHLHRQTYPETRARAKKLAKALLALGVAPGDRIATLAWNTHRHFELYYGIGGIGAVCHTINPRLFHDQITWITNHAEDRILFFDINLTALVNALLPGLPAGIRLVCLCAEADMPGDVPAGTLCYETLLAGQDDDFQWPEFPETTASGLCYTSGTTGNPKGVLYSHRSMILHSFSLYFTTRDSFGIGEKMMVVVPLFHVNAWGLPFLATVAGIELVMPGPKLDGASVFSLMDREGVTISFGVPTVWLMLIDEMRKQGRKPAKLKRVIIGGSAATESLIRALQVEFGIEVIHAWGLTETSPVGSATAPSEDLGMEADIQRKLSQGKAALMAELRLVDDEGQIQPHDGMHRGELLIRSPFVASAYYNDAKASETAFRDGWFHTGDVSTIAPDGYMRIVDRTKDLIKSGGEWISSIDLEAAAMTNPGVAQAAAIAVQHPKWAERPMLVVVRRADSAVTAEEVRATLLAKMAKWQVPEDVVFIDALPMTATGKISKKTLREQFADFYKDA